MTSEAFMLAACIELGLEELDLDAALIRIRELRAVEQSQPARILSILQRHLRANTDTVEFYALDDGRFFVQRWPDSDDPTDHYECSGVDLVDALAQITTRMAIDMEES